MVDLSVKIGDITLQNPIQPASGAFSWEYNDVIDLNRLGALVAKTICREPRLGNPTPRMAETTTAMRRSAVARWTMRAARKTRSAPASELPPNFNTRMPGLLGACNIEAPGSGFLSGVSAASGKTAALSSAGLCPCW